MKKWLTAAVLVVSFVSLTGISFAIVIPINPQSSYPVQISQPGSYQLQGNLKITNPNTTAILVNADNVTIDMNGFSVLGPTVCNGSGSALSCSPTGSGIGIDAGSHTNIKVYNGTIQGMGYIGIYAGSGIIESMSVRSINGPGILILGDAIVSSSIANQNAFCGIAVVSGTLSGNTANSNAYDGIRVSSGTVSGSIANSNGGHGIDVSNGGTVSSSFANYNEGHGIFVGGSGTVSGNSANHNAYAGIFVSFCIVNGNAARSNGTWGLRLESRAGYTNNVLWDNPSGDVAGGVNLGHNLCSGVLCP